MEDCAWLHSAAARFADQLARLGPVAGRSTGCRRDLCFDDVAAAFLVGAAGQRDPGGETGAQAETRLGRPKYRKASEVRKAVISSIASASTAVGGGSPAHGEGRESPTPWSDAAAPPATPARTGSGQRDRRTTRASSPPRPRHERQTYRRRPLQQSRGRVCEPYGLFGART